MLIILPSTPTTEKASAWLREQGIPHRLIPVPADLGYKTDADLALYAEAAEVGDLAMTLTRQRFVVMRVFKDYTLPADSGEAPTDGH